MHAQFRNITYWPANPDTFVPTLGARAPIASPALESRRRGELNHAGYLERVLRECEFDVVHSMEFQHAGYVMAEAIRNLSDKRPIWIATNYGSDIYLFRHHRQHLDRIREVLLNCDFYSAECSRDLAIARELGFRGQLFEICPNSGGVDLGQISSLRSEGPPSRRRTIAIKGYQHTFGRAMLVLDALRSVVPLLRPYRIAIFAPSRDVQAAAEGLRAETGLDLECFAEIETHEKILSLHGRSRLSIANSISDGISTSLLEAMAMGSFPIQSESACAQEWIVDGETGFIVNPDEKDSIAQALRIALQDDVLIDRAAAINMETIRARADSRKVRSRIVHAYRDVVRTTQPVARNLFTRKATLTPTFTSVHLPKRSDPSRPILSVITPTYNRADFLPEVIESVLSQDFTDFEYLIVDDGSEDSTADVIARFNDPRIRYFFHANRGESRTINRAFQLITGDFFTIVNSDDPAIRGSFTRLLSVLDEHPDALMAYPDWYNIDEQSRIIGTTKLIDYDLKDLLTHTSVGIGPGAMFRSSVVDVVGFRNPLIRYAADLDFIYRLALLGPMVHVPEVLGTHRTHSGSAIVASRDSRMALETLSLFTTYSVHPLVPAHLRQYRRTASALGAFAAALVAPHPVVAMKLLLHGFVTHPTAILRELEAIGWDQAIAHFESIGCKRNPTGTRWIYAALHSESRRQAFHSLARAVLSDPLGVLDTVRNMGTPEAEKLLLRMRHAARPAPTWRALQPKRLRVGKRRLPGP